MIVQYILGGLVILLSLVLIGIGINIIYKGEINGVISVLMGIVFIVPGLLIITDESKPTKQDVLDGKAVYQEIITIINNDTIKTYEIVWKNIP